MSSYAANAVVQNVFYNQGRVEGLHDIEDSPLSFYIMVL